MVCLCLQPLVCDQSQTELVGVTVTYGITLTLGSWPDPGWRCGPTFHIEGLELKQVPDRAWEMRQLVPFHIQYLRKETMTREAYRARVQA